MPISLMLLPCRIIGPNAMSILSYSAIAGYAFKRCSQLCYVNIDSTDMKEYVNGMRELQVKLNDIEPGREHYKSKPVAYKARLLGHSR